MGMDRSLHNSRLRLYGFVIGCSPLSVFGAHLASLVSPWGDFGFRLGPFWAALELLGVALGCHGGRLGLCTAIK